MNGKGDKQRPLSISYKQFGHKWDNIFGIKCLKCKTGKLKLITDNLYICDACSSTYIKSQIEN